MFILVYSQSVPVCRGELAFVDIDAGETITLGESDLILSVNYIAFSIQQVRENRHYSVTVTASNAGGLAVSQIGISKPVPQVPIITDTTYKMQVLMM